MTKRKPSVDDNDSPDWTIDEVARFRRESRSQVYKKARRGGPYVAHKNGDATLITKESVMADRDACLKRGLPLGERTGRRGRPRRVHNDAATATTEGGTHDDA